MQVFFFFFFTLQIHCFFFYVGLGLKKKREHAAYDIRHVRPNFSRVRLTKIPGRTGASSHSRKEKKSIRDSETQQKTLPLGLYRGLNQSEIVKGGPPL